MKVGIAAPSKYNTHVTDTQTFTVQREACKEYVCGNDWCFYSWLIGLSSVLRPLQHSIGYMGDGFYRSKDPTNSIKVLKEHKEFTNNTKIQ